MPDSDSNNAPRNQYAMPVGKPGFFLFLLVTVLLVTATTDLISVITLANIVLGLAGMTVDPIDITIIPFKVYGFAVVGGVLRLVYDVSQNEDDLLGDELRECTSSIQDLDSETRASVLQFVIFRQSLAILAGVCLAAGIALVNQITVEFLLRIGPAPSYFAALFAGLYIKETYLSLGNITERLLVPNDDQTPSSDKQTTGTVFDRVISAPENGGSRLWKTQFLVGVPLFVVVTIGIVVILGVPWEVPVYAFIGGLGYVYTALFINAEREASTYSRLKYAFRIGLGILLAVVGHLLLAPGPQAVPVFAFLIGLFPNVILKRIENLAQQFFDRLQTTNRE